MFLPSSSKHEHRGEGRWQTVMESSLTLSSSGLFLGGPMKKQKAAKEGRRMSPMRVGRAQKLGFGSTMQARGVSSVWESAGFASRRSPVRSRYAPLPFVEPISSEVAANRP